MTNEACIKEYDNRKDPIHASQEKRKVDEVKVPSLLLRRTFFLHRRVTHKSPVGAYYKTR